MVRYRDDGSYPSSRTDGTLWTVLTYDVLGDTVAGLSEETQYWFGLFTRDGQGHWSGSSAGARATATTRDTTRPANVTNFTASSLSPDSAVLSWTASAAGDAQKVLVRYSTYGYPPDRLGGEVWDSVSNAVTKDTVYGLGRLERDCVAAKRSLCKKGTPIPGVPCGGSSLAADMPMADESVTAEFARMP